MKTILYVGNFSFPLGNAAGKRVYANGKILRELGYEVIYIGMSQEVNQKISLKATECNYDGFKYYNFQYPKRNLSWLNYKSTFDNLIKLIKEENMIACLDLVIYYGSPSLSFFNTKLIRFCRKNKIKVITDCVDWLTVKTNNQLFNLIKWCDNTYQKTYANKKVDGVITISQYLERYYNGVGCKTVIIPPLSPIKYKNAEVTFRKHHRKVITYAGQPFRKGQKINDLSILKDRIDKTIMLLFEAKQKECEFIFNIYGLTKDEFLYAIPSHRKYLDCLGDSVCFHGYTPNEKVIENIMDSDFTILIRDVNRDTMAGFPTKVSESISCGTPVITTKTSDLSNYIVEGVHGYFIDNEDINKATLEIIRIFNLTSTEVIRMKEECIQSGMFYYKSYTNKLKGFLDEIL